MVALIKWATTRIAPTFLSLPHRTLLNGDDKNESYRKKVQSYSDKTGSIWEDVKFGFIYGSQSFIDRIKDKYLSDKPDDNFP